MSHDSCYETECPHGHGWYFFEDGCAVAGCENAPPTEAPWAYYKGLTNEAALEAWGEARRAEEAKKVGAAPPREPPTELTHVLGQIAGALAEVSALCHGKKWQMRIPVDERTDSDVVIARALSAARTLLEAMGRGAVDGDRG